MFKLLRYLRFLWNSCDRGCSCKEVPFCSTFIHFFILQALHPLAAYSGIPKFCSFYINRLIEIEIEALQFKFWKYSFWKCVFYDSRTWFLYFVSLVRKNRRKRTLQKSFTIFIHNNSSFQINSCISWWWDSFSIFDWCVVSKSLKFIQIHIYERSKRLLWNSLWAADQWIGDVVYKVYVLYHLNIVRYRNV